jgi:arsenate reductase
MKKIVFICVHNAGRSQMAKGKANGLSAGTQPADKVNPMVVAAMREVGIDISRRKPKMLTLKMLEDVGRVITMGCGVEGICPASLVPTEDWQLEDPEGRPIERVRQSRDEVKARVEGLIKEL